MEVFKAQLVNSILGWGLIPKGDNDKGMLTKLYGQDYDTLKKSEVFCLKKATALKDIKKICRDLGVKVSVCGDREKPTLRLWDAPRERGPDAEVSVDLKWSLWSEDKDNWEDYAPGVWKQLEDAFLGKTGSVIVRTAPRKEIHFGMVTVFKGGAEGSFATEWDEPEGLAETLEVEYDEAFREMVPFTTTKMEPGVEVFFQLKAKKFNKLMRRLDQANSELLDKNEEEWKYFKSCFTKENAQ